MTTVKNIRKMLVIEAIIAGLVVFAGAYSNHRYYQGYTDGLLDGVSEGLTMSEKQN